MREHTRVAGTTSGVTVKVSRFTEPTQEVSLAVGATVADALSAAGISLQSNERAHCNGVEAVPPENFEVDNGDIIFVVGSKEGGRF